MLKNYDVRLVKKTQLSSDVLLLGFQLINPAEISFRAGQFLILKIGDRCRAYSIASPDYLKNSFELLVQLVPGGLASGYFSKLIPENKATFQGPAGLFTVKNTGRGRVFLATGCGLAPIRSMVFSGINSCPETRLFWGVPTPNQAYLFNEFKKLHYSSPNFFFSICLSRCPSLEEINEEDKNYFILGRINRALDVFFKTVEDPNRFDYYLCGGADIVTSLKNYLLSLGARQQNISFERF